MAWQPADDRRAAVGALDLTGMKSPFFWRLEGQGRSVAFYLDDVRFE